jgi:hypothetical protein
VVVPFGDQFCLTLLTNDPILAAKADLAGVNRIGLDLERHGKAQRQAGHDARLSDHKVEELGAVAASLQSAKLFVRLNARNPETPDEIETVLAGGAQVLMLPYFHHTAEVEQFVGLVADRAFVVILVETVAAVACLPEILRVGGIGEVMIGLNDLRIEMGITSHFELMASSLLDQVADQVRDVGLAFSLGGVGRPNDRSLPVPPDLVLAQYPRLGATGAWLARSFLRGIEEPQDLADGIASIRRRLTEWARLPAETLARSRDDLLRSVRCLPPQKDARRAVISEC